MGPRSRSSTCSSTRPREKSFSSSPARETALIAETIEALALAAPGVAFKLIDGGREVLWVPAESFGARARRLLGPKIAEHTLAVEGTGRAVRLAGLIGTPQVAETRRVHQWFLVNGRPIRSPLLSRALTQAFHTLIPDDRYPVAVLNVQIEPREVDVNVHPRKAEVRFVRDRDIFDDVVREVRRALHGAPLVHVAAPAREAGAEPAGDLDLLAAGVPGTDQGPHVDAAGTLWEAAPPDAWPEIRLVGQVARTYIVGESGGDLILIDQHAAHERVLYEQILDQRQAYGARAQGLVVPAVLELSPGEMVLMADVGPTLGSLGFQVEPFGPQTVRLTAVPAIAADRAPDELLRACLQDLRADTGPHADRELAERLAIATACHTAVRAGDPLDGPTMTALLAALARARDPFSCFHGRPTIVRVRARDLEHWFYRRT